MFNDEALARRIEAAEALNAAATGESIAVGGGYAMVAGDGSPLMTRVVGVGMNGPIDPREFDRMEEFYRSRGVAVNLDFCPYADASLIDLLGDRGYRIVNCNQVMVGPVAGNPDYRVRAVATGEEEMWTRTMLAGFFAPREATPSELSVARRLRCLESCSLWFSAVNGTLAGAGALNVRSKLAMLYADSTLAPFRGQGLQLAMIRARLQQAALIGCDLATSTVAPGSASQRNYERAGLRVAYTKLTMQRAWT